MEKLYSLSATQMKDLLDKKEVSLDEFKKVAEDAQKA